MKPTHSEFLKWIVERGPTGAPLLTRLIRMDPSLPDSDDFDVLDGYLAAKPGAAQERQELRAAYDRWTTSRG